MQGVEKQLRDVAEMIEGWRESRGLSKNQLCQKFGHLGSTKTYGKILNPDDKLEELNLERQLENYQAAWEVIGMETGDPEDSKIYTHLEHVRDALQSVINATRETGNNRLVLITGERGSGKSAFIEVLQTDKRTANIAYTIEATEAWRDSTNELLGNLLMEVGVHERRPAEEADGKKRDKDPEDRLPIAPGGRLRMLIERLDGRRTILAIDEGHHIGPAGFNILKTIINQTRVVIVLTAIPVLLGRITKSHFAEAQQLFENRLFEVIRFTGPTAAEAIDFMTRRGVKFAGAKAAENCARKVVDDSKAFALWNYVGRVAKKAREMSKGPYTEETFGEVIVKVKSRLTMGN